ncbi:MAG: ABC transporter permease [Lachnospiraceae bacterium]|nr:ABC transporter permease [Lachnospiraceae bacterium]
MQEILTSFMPNLIDKWYEFLQAIVDTIIMELWAGGIGFVLGFTFGITLTVTREGGICENKPVFKILDAVTNLFRSIPFIILLTALMPLSRAIMGTAINIQGAIVPLVFGSVPFFTRQVQSALAQVQPGLVEAAESMGLSNFEIITRVYLRESAGQLARATTITAISLLGLTAMAGVVGAGGLGDFAIRYGHDRNMKDITWATVVILVIAVSLLQLVGDTIAKKSTH